MPDALLAKTLSTYDVVLSFESVDKILKGDQ